MRQGLVCTGLTKCFEDGERSTMSRVRDWYRGRQAPLKKVVDSVGFQVNLGDIFGVLGPNGSGKSTLIRMVATLLIPDSGSMTLFGEDAIERVHIVRRQMNRVSVDAALFSKMSAVENLLYAARLYGLPRSEQAAKVHELLEMLGFTARQINEPVETFSRGMQQKVSIARAFLSKPRLLLLDEPTTGLDPGSKQDVQRLIRNLKEKGETAMILTTHDMAEAERLCDTVAIISEGRFLAKDTPAKLIDMLPPDAPERSLEAVFLHMTGKGP